MRLRRLAPALVLGALGLALPSTSEAVQPHALFGDRPVFELRARPGDAAPRDASVRGPLVWDRAPRSVAAAYNTFLHDMAQRGGFAFRAGFDQRTGVPSRIFGAGVHVPGSVHDPLAAEAFAKEVIAAHVRLLAPGARASDLLLVSNDLDAGTRTLGFVQTSDGLRVRGGQVSFRFKNDRLQMIGSEARPFVPSASSLPHLGQSDAEKAAVAYVQDDFGRAAARGVAAVEILPYRASDGQLRYARVLPIEVETLDVPGRFLVFVEVGSGEPVAREQLLRFASSSVLMRVPERAPTYGMRVDAPAVLASVNFEGTAGVTNELGGLSWMGSDPTPIELFLTSSRVRVWSDTTAEASLLVALADATPFVWDASDDEVVDAQLSAFVHSEKIREFARGFAPQQSFLNTQIKATVNIDDVCNAYSDGTTINFYMSSDACENTGRLADVIYHEFGHSLHYHAIIEGVGAFDGALSEGFGDYLAATTTGDPATARGFFKDSDPLRHIDPPNKEHRWPDDLVGEVHEDGLIVAGALWDMRTELIDKLGAAEGALLANTLFYQGMRRAVDTPTMYLEVLAADDDDGDLTNGTPNVCEINRAFELHGLRSRGTSSSSLGVVPLSTAGYEVEVALTGLYPQCPEDVVLGGTLTWRDRESPSSSGQVELASSPTGFFGTIPEQPAGTVVKYRIDVELAGNTVSLPANAADQEYELFVGEVLPLYCTDFESDPEAEGWTHGLISGEDIEGADDWMWGEANGSATNGDPAEAFSGEHVFGNDLALMGQFNGLYQPNKVNYAAMPVVDVQGHTNVRLQYRRWLNVEDAHFDQASIKVGDTVVWQNLDSDEGDGSSTQHQDREWRFHDVDLSEVISAEGTVEVRFEIASDGGLEMGGWTLDDVCIVALVEPPPCQGDACGEGGVGGAGGGDAANDLEDPELTPEGGCACRATAAGRDGDLLWGLSLLALFGLRRRR